MKNKVRKEIGMSYSLKKVLGVEEGSLCNMSKLFRNLICILILSTLISSLPCFVFAATSEQNDNGGNVSLAPVEQETQAITLTEEERAWLKGRPDIVLGYTDAFEPEVIVNPDGSLRGIQVDILNELNRRLGTRIRLQIDSVPTLVEKAKKREVDGILSLHPEYADELGLLKTGSYFTGYPTVFARKDVGFSSFSDLDGKRVAVIDKVFFSRNIIEQHGQESTVLKVQNAEEAFRLVDKGQADYFLGASLNAYLITV